MTKTQFQTNYSEDKDRREIIQRLFDSGRVYFFPEQTQTGFVLVTNLSTAILVCPQDLQNPKRLKHIVEVAMEYPLTEIDTEVLHAISMFRKGFDTAKDEEHRAIKYNYNVLSLFCFLADLVSIHPNNANFDGSNKTFLQACREIGFTMKLGEEPDYNKLWDKFSNVISILKLNAYIPNDFLSRWQKEWEFDAFGEINSAENLGSATYNRLAVKISEFGGRFIGVGQCISYAHGNRQFFKENQCNTSTASERNSYILARAAELISNHLKLEWLIDNGKRLRQERLLNLIWDNHELKAAQQNPVPDEVMRQGLNYLRDHLFHLPIDTLRIIDSADYAIAHVNQENLQNIYPKETMPSFTISMMRNGREAGAETLSRFRLMLDSNGLEHPNPRMGVTLERWIHESAHIAFGNNGYRKLGDGYTQRNERYEDVCKKFAQACLDLYRTNDSVIDQESDYLRFKWSDGMITHRTLRSIINPIATVGKYTKEQHKEELMVECLGLVVTEYADPNKPNNIFTNYRVGEPAFDNFRAALAEVKQLYHDAAIFMQQTQYQQEQQQFQRR